MLIRTYEDDLMYVIEAPEGSMFAADDQGIGELIIHQEMSNGTTIERRLPSSVVIKAAYHGLFGLIILDRRTPMAHPEVVINTVSRNG